MAVAVSSSLSVEYDAGTYRKHNPVREESLEWYTHGKDRNALPGILKFVVNAAASTRRRERVDKMCVSDPICMRRELHQKR